MRNTRPISWLKPAQRDFKDFPTEVQLAMRRAISFAAEGGKDDKAKPLTGFDGGIFEVALQHRGDAFRVVYALHLDPDVLVIDAFQKKSKTGIKTPKQDLDRIRDRIKRIKEAPK